MLLEERKPRQGGTHRSSPERSTPGLQRLQILGLDEGREALLQAFGPQATWAMPRVEHSTPAGFPSPAADFETQRVDLVDQLGLHLPTTFIVRVRGLSMIGKGIADDDLLVVNRMLEARHGHTVVAVVDNELTCKTLYKRGSTVKLQAANPDYPDIVPQDGQSMTVWGVVVAAIKTMV
jgi:DNA polymerase V